MTGSTNKAIYNKGPSKLQGSLLVTYRRRTWVPKKNNKPKGKNKGKISNLCKIKKFNGLIIHKSLNFNCLHFNCLEFFMTGLIYIGCLGTN